MSIEKLGGLEDILIKVWKCVGKTGTVLLISYLIIS